MPQSGLKSVPHIAFISHLGLGHTGWGGSEELWIRTAIRLASQGVRVSANIVSRRPPESIQALEAAGCKLTTRTNRSLVQKVLARVQRTDLIGRWLQQVAPDLVVISQGGNLDGVGWMETCARQGVPYVLISHSAAEFQWPDDGVAERAIRAYQAARQCFFVSQNNLDLTVKQLGVYLERSQVIRNPFSVAYQPQLSWPDSSPVWKLACVGRLEPWNKGQDLLFEVLRSEKWRSRPLEVTLFGTGQAEASLQRLQQLWHLDQVKFAGFVKDVEKIWADHHALVLPSRSEGLPLVVVEAMLCGRIGIVTDVAGAELIEDNVHGFVASAAKACYLDSAMERAWQQRHTWYEMGQAAAVHVRTLVPADPVGVFAATLRDLL